MHNVEVMLLNFKKKHGSQGLRTLLNMFLERRSNQEIANLFGVSRQRVYQWQQVLVDISVGLKPDVATVLSTKYSHLKIKYELNGPT